MRWSKRSLVRSLTSWLRIYLEPALSPHVGRAARHTQVTAPTVRSFLRDPPLRDPDTPSLWLKSLVDVYKADPRHRWSTNARDTVTAFFLFRAGRREAIFFFTDTRYRTHVQLAWLLGIWEHSETVVLLITIVNDIFIVEKYTYTSTRSNISAWLLLACSIISFFKYSALLYYTRKYPSRN